MESAFVILGIFFSFVCLFIALSLTIDIDNIFIRIIAIFIISSSIGFTMSWVMCLDYQADYKEWNNGICEECEEPLKLVGVNKHNYYYSCENNHIIETHFLFEKND